MTESHKCSKQASVFQTCAQYLANLIYHISIYGICHHLFTILTLSA